MAKPWAAVASSPQYQALPPEQKEAARRQYFDQVVAPQIGDPAQVEQARAQFDAQTGQAKPKPKADFRNVQAQADTVAPVTIGGEDAATMPAWKNAAYGLVSPFAKMTVGVGQATGLMGPDEVQASQQRIDAVQSRTPGKVAAFGGEVVALAAPMTKLAALPRLAQYAGSGGIGALWGAAQPVREGESRGTNTAIGGGLGLAGQAGGELLVRSGTKAAQAIAPHVREIWKAAKARGIELTPAQLSDSRLLKFLASQMQMLPLSGAQAKAAAQKSAWNREVAKEIGVDAPAVTPEVYAAKKAADTQAYADLTERNALTVTEPLVRKLLQIRKDAERVGGDVAASVKANVDDFLGRIQDGGVVPGVEYQAFDTSLGQIVKLGTPTSVYVGRLQKAVRDAMDDSISPADQAAWRKLRREYGNRKTVRDLVAGGDGGELSPAALRQRVTSNNAGKEAMASGTRGGLGDLARIGQRMKEPPSSGSAERMLVNSAFNPLMWPALGLGSLFGATVGRAVNSRGLASLLMSEGRGQGRQWAGKHLTRPAAAAALPKKPEDDKRKRP